MTRYVPRWTGIAILVAVSASLILTSLPVPHGGVASSIDRRVSPPVPASPAPRSSLAMATSPSSTGVRAGVAIAPAVAGSPSWVNVTSAHASERAPQGYGMSVTYDASDNLTVYFGGCLATACPSDQTWVFAHGVWKNLTDPTDAPPARINASMDFDARMGALLMFGGQGVGRVLLNDSWTFQGGRWTNVSYVGGGPAAREGATLAFDPAPEENGSVLFGGCVPGLVFACFNDTWVWQAWSGWVALSPSVRPPGAAFSAMAYDAQDGYLVLYGGCGGFLCLGVSNQTWELYGGQWWPAYPARSPGPVVMASLVDAPSARGLVLFGGYNGSFALGSYTWLFSNGAWSNISAATGPAPRAAAGLALDPTGSCPLLVGGQGSSSYLNDTWALEYPAAVSLSTNSAMLESSQPVTFSVGVTGGTAPYDVLVAFGDGTAGTASGPGPTITLTHSYGAAGSYAPTANLTDAFGTEVSTVAPAITVSSGPGLSATAIPAAADIGTSVALASRLTSPGTPPLTYAWSFGDNATASGSNASHAYASAGTYPVRVTVTDGSGGTASAFVNVTIAVPPAAVLSVSPNPPSAAATTSFLASISGGTEPFAFSWSFGDGGHSVLPSPVHVFSAPGTFAVQLWMNDSGGGSTHQSLSVTVGAAAPSPSQATSSSSGAPSWFWPAILGLVVVGAAGSYLIARRSRPAPPRP